MPEPPEPPAADLSDAALLGRYRRGEDDAATELDLRYAGRPQAAQAAPDLQRRIDPDDIVQSVFRTFFRRAAAGQYEVPAGEELWKLFLVIGPNKVRAVAAHHRAARRDVRATAVGGEFEKAADDTPAADDADLHVLRLTIDEPPAPGRAKRSVERILQEFREALRGRPHDPD